MNPIAESELILNPDGSVYHLKLKPENIADNVIVVGDQDRVEMISAFFDNIEFKMQCREFVTHTGSYKGKRVTVLSTGIGTDNIDIVINELDAVVNIDLHTRLPKKEHRTLNIIRIGTSGALQADIDVDSFLFSSYGLGFDGLMNFYDAERVYDKGLINDFAIYSKWPAILNQPYAIKASDNLLNKLGFDQKKGITATACGFYAPQGRKLRLDTRLPDINSLLTNYKYGEHRLTNFEMETSALYGLSAMLGHNAVTACVIVANRIKKEFSKDYKKSVKKLIELILERV